MSNPTLQQRLADIKANPAILSFYVKSGCKKCNGKGIMTINLIHPNVSGNLICDCVLKALRKEVEATHG